MSDGDVLGELRAWRDEFARSHGYDVAAMAAALRDLDRAAGGRVVPGTPRPPAAGVAVQTPNQPLQQAGPAGAATPLLN